MKAIVVAAGMGRRLSPYTDELPKCLVPVGERSILGWQLRAFRACGVREVVVVRGYKGDVLEERAAELWPGMRFANNAGYRDNNILLSLFCAEHELAEADEPVLITYSDIIYTTEVVRRAVASPGDVALVIDRDFAKVYEGRTDHPLEEGEVSDLFPDCRVRRVGKRALPPDEAWGEFIGLVKLSPEGVRWVMDAWRELRAQYAGREDQPFQRAAAFRNAYLTDLLQHMIDAGRPVTPVEIRGAWREIDTVQDLERARALLRSEQEDFQ